MDILIDYLSFTSKVHSADQLKEMFGLKEVNFIDGRPHGGWARCDFVKGVRIFYGGGREDVGAEISGTGCRLIESANEEFDWAAFFDYLISFGEDINISRLDVACDEKQGILDFDKMVKYVRQDRYISRAQSRRWIDGDEQSLILGSPTSSTRLRIYNKALERDVDGHWMRSEFQLRDESADRFLSLFQRTRHIGKAYSGLLFDYLRFITERTTDVNFRHERATIVSWWDEFLGTSLLIPRVLAGGLEYNVMDAEDYVKKQASSSLRFLIEYYDGDASKVFEAIEGAKLNKRQQLALLNKDRGLM